jgi:hypothetical protein
VWNQGAFATQTKHGRTAVREVHVLGLHIREIHTKSMTSIASCLSKDLTAKAKKVDLYRTFEQGFVWVLKLA